MLTGTLITAAAFTPVGFAKSSAGEYTFSIFAVVTIALLVSWVVAVLFTPYLGYKLLPDLSHHAPRPSLFRGLLAWTVASLVPAPDSGARASRASRRRLRHVRSTGASARW